MTFAGYVLLGLVAGIVSGVVGIGGGIIIVPALVLLFGLSQHTAQGTTMAMLVLPIGILGAWVYHREGFVEISIAGWMAAGFLIGSLAGARIAVHLPGGTLEKIFGLIMVFIGMKLIFGR
jgi:uncharacterized membrane protein YfcA